MLEFLRSKDYLIAGIAQTCPCERPNAPAAILSSIESAYVVSNPFPSKPSIVFLAQKPFCSQPNYSIPLGD